MANQSIKGFNNIINDIPLKYKFLLIYLLCVLIPIIAINLFFNNQVSQNIRIREQENIAISMNRATVEVTRTIEELVGLSYTISTDRALYEAMDRTYESPLEFYQANDTILRNKLKVHLPVHPNLLELGIYTNNDTIASGGEYFYLDKQLRETSWYKKLQSSTDQVMVYAYTNQASLFPNKPARRISIIYRLDYFLELRTYDKYLKIDLSMDKMNDILNSERDYLEFRLVDNNDRIVMSSRQMDSTGSPEMQPLMDDLGDETVHFERALGSANYMRGWKLIGISNHNEVSDGVTQSQRFTIALMIVSTFIPTVLIVIILRSYHYRMNRLSRQMKKVRSGRFDPLLLTEGKDEIGGLIQSYNLMTGMINSLINDVYKLEIQKKDLELERVRAELNFLQSQLNPHFLFNTLNAMLVVSTKNEYTQITDIIKNLSLILRRLLSWTDDLVTLQEEVHFTEMYLQIEKFRFRERFDYTLTIDESVLLYTIPKMSIQPLVENACKHGFQATRGIRNIHITAQVTEGKLVVSVGDNGMGMDENRIQEIIESTRATDYSGTHVGIRNVYKRLELYYDGYVDFRIESRLGRGTQVEFSIPLSHIQRAGSDIDRNINSSQEGR
ncbi:sensor histidine kinase [Paenibacillus sp. FA6]|uniref:sensor histidine kinase n=1 Tax=Paenibacillus sp. FA6 TaxID=3413029 RepID=UPI003F65E51B